MGIMASRLPAISTGKLVAYCPFRVERDNIQDHQTDDGGSYHDQPPETPITTQF